MQRTCANPQCKRLFEITQEDLAFYEKISPVFPSTALGAGNGKKELIPAPTLCPDCRWQRRLAWRNERHLHHATCNSCQKNILSMYVPAEETIQYCQDCYFGDEWDGVEQARDGNLQQPFFQQFSTLFRRIPKLHLYVKSSENCEFTNIALENKNCYLLVGSGFSRDCYYGTHIFYCENCVDATFSERCEECYEVTNCEKCYRCVHSLQSQQCHNSAFLFDCRDCDSCINCWNLRNKKYFIENVAVSAEEFNRYRQEKLPALLAHPADTLRSIALRALHRPMISVGSEEVSGDFVYHSKNAHDCYNIDGCHDVVRLAACIQQKDSHDALGTSLGELAYDCFNDDWPHQTGWCMNSTYLDDCWYCDSCDHGEHLFGCVGLKHKKYCILNKQYSKEEYERLVPQIIAKMRADKKWGEFFPVELSPFAYNETVAQEYFPLTKAEALKRGWKWREEKEEAPKVSKVIPAEKLPDSNDDVPDDILNWAIECEATKRPFRIIRQELDFYRKMRLPIPRFHPDERHRRRLALRNPRKLWKRPCMKCQKEMQTTYSPDRPEIVYCEQCYLKEVY
ncbi:MAG: hypothetical protein PHX87_03135 [Candidatus Peribacteraceae bacterium]|nr:hypothetical protein [Candidatus Peribacteraceae bacterium]MDD5742401.1 hypothetical protein [Candidatus Peribacteraceae bacterium]